MWLQEIPKLDRPYAALVFFRSYVFVCIIHYIFHLYLSVSDKLKWIVFCYSHTYWSVYEKISLPSSPRVKLLAPPYNSVNPISCYNGLSSQSAPPPTDTATDTHPYIYMHNRDTDIFRKCQCICSWNKINMLSIRLYLKWRLSTNNSPTIWSTLDGQLACFREIELNFWCHFELLMLCCLIAGNVLYLISEV